MKKICLILHLLALNRLLPVFYRFVKLTNVGLKLIAHFLQVKIKLVDDYYHKSDAFIEYLLGPIGRAMASDSRNTTKCCATWLSIFLLLLLLLLWTLLLLLLRLFSVMGLKCLSNQLKWQIVQIYLQP